MNDIIKSNGNRIAGLGLAGGLAGLFDFPFPDRLAFPRFEDGFEAWEEGDDVHLSFDAPGFEKDEVSVSFEDGVLRVSGKKSPAEDKSRKYLTRRVAKSFERSFSLPDGVDASKGRAEYKNGVLTVSFPKTEEAKPRTIKVE